MIFDIGCDIVDFQLIDELEWATNPKIASRIFSDREIKAYNKNKKLSYLAGRFATKEAVLKCLGTGMQNGISLRNIEVLQSESGKPLLELTGEVLRISNLFGIKKWFVSISHSEKSSISYVIAET